MPNEFVSKLKKEKIFFACILLFAIIFLARPLVVMSDYPLLQTWDSWNHYVFAKAIFDNGGLVPNWYNIELFPMGRPFLYPPLVPMIFAWISIITSLDLFLVIRSVLSVSYLVLFFSFLLLVKEYENKKIIILSIVFLFTIMQLFVASINNFAQVLEIIFFLSIIYFIYKKKFLPASILFGLTFYIHFATPIFFALFILLVAIFDKKQSKNYFKTLIAGFLIGFPWLFRFVIFSDWIQPNLLMKEHTSFFYWFWRFGVEGFSFVVLLLFIIFFFLMNKQLVTSFFSKPLNKLLALYTLAFIPGFFYPERVIGYICFPIVIFSAQLFVRYFEKSLFPALLSGFVSVLLLKMFMDPSAGLVLVETQGALILIYLCLFLLLIVFFIFYHGIKKGLFSKLFFILFIVLLCFNPAVYGVVLPFESMLVPLDVSMQLPAETAEACAWIKNNYPNAIIVSTDNRISALCISYGLKTTNYMVMEFAKKGNDYPHEKYATHLISYSSSEASAKLLWNNEIVFVHSYVK